MERHSLKKQTFFSLLRTNKLLKAGKNEGVTSNSKSDKNAKTEDNRCVGKEEASKAKCLYSAPLVEKYFCLVV